MSNRKRGRDTNRARHYRMWKWLAETGGTKGEWPEWDTNGGTVPHTHLECHACEESVARRWLRDPDYEGGLSSCADCPLPWTGGETYNGAKCCNPAGEFTRWAGAAPGGSMRAAAAALLKLKWKPRRRAT